MARKLKIQAQHTKTIAEAFSNFLLHKKALGVSDKTLKTYSQHFSAVCKYLDSSAPIAGLFKRPLDEMIEQMPCSSSIMHTHVILIALSSGLVMTALHIFPQLHSYCVSCIINNIMRARMRFGITKRRRMTQR